MSDAERRLAEDRATRQSARALFDARLAQVRSDLAERGIGGRVADKVKSDALALARESVAVVKDSKGIVAGTLALLLGWIFRRPLIAGLSSLFDKRACAEEAGVDEKDDESE